MGNEAVKYLLKKEWSMGNGQCPDCYGVPARWHGHPLHLTSETIGHKKDCPLAASLVALGQTPLMIGDFKTALVYESYITDGGFLSTRPKTPDGCPKIRAMNEKSRQELDAKFIEILTAS